MKFFTHLTLYVFLLTICNQVFAQKLRDKAINPRFVQLPEKKLPDEFMTFSVYVYGSAFNQAGTSREAFAKRFNMDGFKKLSGIGKNAGHLRVIVNSGYITTKDTEFKSGTTKSKDKDGNETTKKYYYYEVAFSNSANYRIVDPEGQILASGSFPKTKSFDSDRHSSSASLVKARGSIVNKLRLKFAKETTNGIYNTVQEVLNKRFDYDKVKDRQELYLIKGHASQDQFEKHYYDVDDIFNSTAYDIKSEELAEKFSKAIEFYSGHASKSPRGDKKLKRIYKAANYNLAILYYYTDQFEKAKEHCQAVIDSEGKDAKSKRLLKKMERQEKIMENIDIHTLHFFRDLSKAFPPSKLAELEAEKEEMMEENMTTKGQVFKGDEVIEGTLSLDKEAKEMVFGDGGNVKFLVENGAEMEEVDLLDPAITEFVIADRKFKKIRFSPSAKGAQEATLQILEQVYSSEQIRLFKYYPSSGALSDEKPEFAFQKGSQEFPVSLESTEFLLWKKGLATYFEECPDLADMIKEGGIAKTKEDLIKASRIYSELCERTIKP